MTWAEPSNVSELLAHMVRVNTVNPALADADAGELALVEPLERLCNAWGFATRRLPVPDRADQLLVMHEVDAARPWLLFDSHLDTVSATGMTIEPFSGEVREGRLYGRGSCDTKGTGAAMLWALRRYARGEEHPNNVAILFGVDEEVTMTGVQAFIQRDLPGLPWRPSGVVVGEPTDLHPVIAHNGAVRWAVTTYGTAAHSSVPHEGESAITAMARVIQTIERDYAATLNAEHERTGRAVCTINMIRGGTAPNIIPDRCTIELDRRLVPGEEPQDVLPAVASLLDRLGVRYSQEIRVLYPPLDDGGNLALTDAAVTVLREAGLPTMTVGAPFCTHAAHYAAAALPAIVLGPGDPHKAHTKDEWVDLAKIDRGVAVYQALMRCDRFRPSSDRG